MRFRVLERWGSRGRAPWNLKERARVAQWSLLRGLLRVRWKFLPGWVRPACSVLLGLARVSWESQGLVSPCLQFLPRLLRACLMVAYWSLPCAAGSSQALGPLTPA